MNAENTEPKSTIAHGDGPYRTVVAAQYQNLSEAEVESLLRRATGVLARNEWRRRYQGAREEDRARVIESAAANAYRICGRWKASCDAAARMIAEPLESERICEKCRWYTPMCGPLAAIQGDGKPMAGCQASALTMPAPASKPGRIRSAKPKTGNSAQLRPR